MKKCTRCKKELPLESFYSNKAKKDGLSTECKICVKEKTSKYYLDNIEIERQKRSGWYQKNKESAKKRAKDFYHKNIDRIKLYRSTAEYKNRKNELRRIWYQKNKDRILARTKIAMQKHKPKRNLRFRIRRATDPKFRLDCNLSSQISEALKGNKKGKSWQSMVGYSLNELVSHIEKQFDSKMNWNNYGSYWHLDHILPRVHFKYQYHTDPEFKKCWCLSNLRPLEAKENIRKGARLVL